MNVKSTIAATAVGCAQVKTKSYGLPLKGSVTCQIKIGAAMAGIRKLRNRANPAAIDDDEEVSPTVECIQPNRNPQTGLRPLLRYAYCPPASGIAAPSSANESAPKSESNPPTIHAA